jgi:arsenite methyltransferase
MFRFDLDSDELARAYGHASAFLFTSGRTLVQTLRVAPGESVLDVGCGTGLLADYVSRVVGADGVVVGIDPLPLRVAIAQQRARPNLRFAVGNALDLGTFAADSFDVAYLHHVFHWLPDRVEPLRQLRRVVKPGGRIGLTTSARDHENTFEAVWRDVVSHPPYSDYPEARVSQGSRVTGDELDRLLRVHGFDEARIEVEPTSADWPTADEAIDFSETISAGNLLGHLPEPLRQPARLDLARALERRRTPRGITITGARIVAIAIKR